MTSTPLLNVDVVEDPGKDPSECIQLSAQIYKKDKQGITDRLKQTRLKIENKTLVIDRWTRVILIIVLGFVSIIWLVFTGYTIRAIGLDSSCYHLNDSVAIAFITTSLGTVLGLLAIGLRYFFSREKI
jgi:hypothetical protein